MEYSFDGITYSDIFSLAKDFYRNDRFLQALHSDELIDFIAKEDAQKAERIEKLRLQSVPDDVMLFRAALILNPFLPFSFHHQRFESLSDIGKYMLSFSPSPDTAFLGLLRYELITEYMGITRYKDSHKEEYEEVKEIEHISRNDMTYAYYCMGYYLSKSKSIIYDHVEYKDIYNLTYFLVKKEKDLNALGSYLSFSPLLKAYGKYTSEGGLVDSYLHLCKELDESKEHLDAFLEKRKRKLLEDNLPEK